VPWPSDLPRSRRPCVGEGSRKSDADLLIAATSLKEGAILVSNDQAFHDQAIDGLAVEDWLALG